jgi:exonuclease III
MHNTHIKFLQINIQHSWAATNNLMKTIEEDDRDVICIQEPYVINNKVVGIPRKYKILAHGEGRHRAAIVM